MDLCLQTLTLGGQLLLHTHSTISLLLTAFMLFVAFGIALLSKQLGDSEMKKDIQKMEVCCVEPTKSNWELTEKG